MASETIERLIPHREPFLWVDEIVTQGERDIETRKHIPVDLPLFGGHYPDYPIMPGVLLCEAVFQSGALLIASQLAEGETDGRVPVLTRILEAKFKRQVRPGDTIAMRVALTDREGPAWFLKGEVRVAGNTAVKVKFVCTLAEQQGKERR